MNAFARAQAKGVAMKLVAESKGVSLDGVVFASDVQLERVNWLWKNWMARGAINFVDGDPGLGKSTALIDVAARITRGDVMPDGSAGLDYPGVVMFVLGEDTQSTLRARLEAAGADVSKCPILDYVGQGKTKRHPTIPEDLPRIEQLIRALTVDWLIIDPWFASTSSTIDTDRDASARLALTPTARMAEETLCAVTGLRHFKKGTGSALQRGMSSMAHSAAARSVLAAGVDPADRTKSVLAVAKSNLGPKPKSLGFCVEGTTERPDGTTIVDTRGFPMTTSRCRWLGENAADADALAEVEDAENRRAVDDAVEFLRVELSNGDKTAKEVKTAAAAAGLSWRTVERAKAKIGIKVAKRHFQGAWMWCLPNTATNTKAANVGGDSAAFEEWSNSANNLPGWRSGGVGGDSQAIPANRVQSPPQSPPSVGGAEQQQKQTLTSNTANTDTAPTRAPARNDARGTIVKTMAVIIDEGVAAGEITRLEAVRGLPSFWEWYRNRGKK